jgi:hypothetical protein
MNYSQSVRGIDLDLGKINGELARLPMPSRATQLESDIERIFQEIQNLESTVTELTVYQERLVQVQHDLDELGNPRDMQTQQKGIASQRASLETEQSARLWEKQELVEQQDEYEHRLLAFDGLDKEIEETNHKVEQHREAHEVYIANQKTAQTEPERRATVELVSQHMENATRQHQELDAKFKQAQEAYDADIHKSVRQKVEQNNARIVQTTTEIKGWQNEEITTSDEYASLQQVQQEWGGCLQRSNTFRKTGEGFRFYSKGYSSSRA